MPLENIPWAVLDGITSASLARMLAYQATGGEEGVAGIGDLAVRQQTVAAGSVVIANGGAVLVNRYPGVKNESYMARAGDETTLAVPANATGSVRTDMVICYIDDWNFAGQQPTPDDLPTNTVAVAKFKVLTGVSASAKRAKDLNLNYPAIALARLTVPANTSAITQAMITSLREKAVPRRKRDLRVVAQKVGRDNSLTVTTAAGEQFPNDAAFTVEIPDWASELRVTSTLGGVLAPAGTASGVLWIRVGHGRSDVINTEAAMVDVAAPHADASRETTFTGATVAIPATMRGQSVTVLLMGKKVGGTVNLKADYATAIELDMEFVESASEDV